MIKMRILFLESHPMWIHGLPNGFRDAGHQVMISGPLTEKKLVDILVEFQPNLIVSMGWGPENTMLQKQDWMAKHVKGSGIPHIYWATEDPTHALTFTLPFLRRVQPDFVFTICLKNAELYNELGIKAAHLDFGYHRVVHQSTAVCSEYSCTIAVVANAYANKLTMYPEHFRHKSLKILIAPLLDKNIRVDFYGNSWGEMQNILGRDIPQEMIHGPVAYTDANKVYSSCPIILGIQNHLTQLTQRTYEILGSGGFLLTNNTPEINRLFKAGQDLAVTDSPEETLRLVEYYLAHPDERKAIQEQGQIAVAKYSYKNRAEYIVETLESHGIFAGSMSNYHIGAIETLLSQTNNEEVYRVINGDTLWSLSRRFNIPLEQLKNINGLNTDVIFAGQILNVKKYLLYNVSRGDTLWGIGQKFGTSIEEIKGLNDIDSDAIQVGQLLKVKNNKKIPWIPLSLLISKGISGRKQLSLTYDAGDGAGGAAHLLDILKKHAVRGTFFLTGAWVEKYPYLAKRIAAEGHEIGNHSYSHPDFTKLTASEIAEELGKTEAIVKKVTGADCRPLFRPPYGAWNEEVLKAVGDIGYSYSIYWSIDTVDWKQPAPELIVNRILEGAKSNDIVLMHLEYPTSAAASEEVIARLKQAGFELVPVSSQLTF